jgi:dolichyl-phosphate beta-glucosyltransferase
VLAVPALVTLAVIFQAQLRERLPHAVRAVGVALATFAVLAAYPLYIFLFGPQRVSGALEGFGFVARPTSFLVPSSFELISGLSSVQDSSVYVGVPLLILAAAVTLQMRRRAAVMVAAVTLACAMLLALGGHLTIHGGPTSIPLPWIILEHLPVLGNVLPVRLMVIGYLALAVIVAVFIDQALSATLRWRVAGLAAVAVALVPLVPSLPIPSGHYVIPAFFTDGSVRQLSQTGSVLVTPYGTDVPDQGPEVWEAISGMAFRTQVGAVYSPGPGGQKSGPDMDPLGIELHNLRDLDQQAPAELSASVRDTYMANLRAHDVRSVVVGPSVGQEQVARLFTELLGSPGLRTGGVIVWYDVHP